MRSLLTLPLIVLFTVSCAATTPGTETTEIAETIDSKTDQRAIDSVIFVNSSPPLSATLRRDQTLTINKDLSTRFEIKDGYNKLLNEKTGTITQQQFDALAGKLNQVDYTRLKPQKRAEPMLGTRTNKLIVKSDQGAHRFIDGAMTTFPTELEGIFAAQIEYLPSEPAIADKTEEEPKSEPETGDSY